MAFILQEFPLVATLQNFRKRALRVPLATMTKFGFTGSLGAAVCIKMLCWVGA